MSQTLALEILLPDITLLTRLSLAQAKEEFVFALVTTVIFTSFFYLLSFSR